MRQSLMLRRESEEGKLVGGGKVVSRKDPFLF